MSTKKNYLPPRLYMSTGPSAFVSICCLCTPLSSSTYSTFRFFDWLTDILKGFKLNFGVGILEAG